MLTGKALPKLVPSFSRRRIRLGVSHSGSASSWSAPSKDERSQGGGKPQKGKRR
ncbi:MAG TPA: hypothetical protein VGM39_00045 [Kofleriaceae bacterium]